MRAFYSKSFPDVPFTKPLSLSLSILLEVVISPVISGLGGSSVSTPKTHSQHRGCGSRNGDMALPLRLNEFCF
jgi:hypothetical protein